MRQYTDIKFYLRQLSDTFSNPNKVQKRFNKIFINNANFHLPIKIFIKDCCDAPTCLNTI